MRRRRLRKLSCGWSMSASFGGGTRPYHLPTTAGRHLALPHHTQPTRDHKLLLDQIKPRLPE